MSGISEPRELLAPGQLSLQPRLDRDLPPGHRFLLPVPRSPALAAESLHQELLRHRHPHPCRRPTGTGRHQLPLVWEHAWEPGDDILISYSKIVLC